MSEQLSTVCSCFTNLMAQRVRTAKNLETDIIKQEQYERRFNKATQRDVHINDFDDECGSIRFSVAERLSHKVVDDISSMMNWYSYHCAGVSLPESAAGLLQKLHPAATIDHTNPYNSMGERSIQLSEISFERFLDDVKNINPDVFLQYLQNTYSEDEKLELKRKEAARGFSYIAELRKNDLKICFDSYRSNEVGYNVLTHLATFHDYLKYLLDHNYIKSGTEAEVCEFAGLVATFSNVAWQNHRFLSDTVKLTSYHGLFKVKTFKQHLTITLNDTVRPVLENLLQ